jgi:Dihaem cytochrome c
LTSKPPSARCRALLGALAGLALTAAAHADDDTRSPAAPRLPRYAQECGACHLAYPPGLLPAASWQRLMSTLPRHFGTDASLDAAAQKEIAGWLNLHAGSARKLRRDPTPPAEDRISRAAWFASEHREVPAATWRLPAVKSASNCGACHTLAEEGDFSERHIRLPR